MVNELRKLMKDRNIDIYVITSGDAHSSEYVSDYWKLRNYITGFTGSAGVAAVTQDKAILWTDGRYFIQAAKELKGFELYKSGVKGVPTLTSFLAKEIKKGGRIGFDGRTASFEWFENIKKALEGKDAKYAFEEDVAGLLWKERPSLPTGVAFEHEPRFAGVSAADKLNKVREKMKEKGFGSYLVTALDDIAWLLNIRGNDVDYSPVVYAFAFITEKDAHVFVDGKKLANITAKVTSQGFRIHEYDAVTDYVKGFNSGKMFFNGAKTNVLLAGLIDKNVKIESKSTEDILPLLKSVKSKHELENIKKAYIREGAALVRTFMWIDGLKKSGKITEIHEAEVAKKLTEFRRLGENYMNDSFSTISAYGANAASAHYHAAGEGAKLAAEGFLLIDTGGQYFDGTTDTTRTIPLGPVTDEMKKDYTLVLQCHISIDQAVFASGTTGHALDVLGRMAMWKEGINFLHGVGHGIGYCLNVHEGPQGITQRHNPVALQAGMLVTNEPALYREGKYGIRTENVVVVTEKEKNEFGEFLQFETIMFCPINTEAINVVLLSDNEKAWLNDYHAKTFEKLSPLLDEEEKAWLRNATKAV